MPAKGTTTIPGGLEKRYVRTPGRRLGAKAAAKRIEQRERQQQALELRKSGMTYEEIAKALNYSHASGAAYAVKSAIDRIGLEAAKDVVVMDLARLDDYTKRCTAELRAKGDLSQVDRLLRIMQVRHGLLGINSDTFREEQAKQANTSITNNAVMVVQGSESDFVSAMMKAVGMDTSTPEVQAHLARMDAENRKAEAEGKTEVVRLALPPGTDGEPAPVVEVKRKRRVVRRPSREKLDAEMEKVPAAPSKKKPKRTRVRSEDQNEEQAPSPLMAARDVVQDLMSPPTEEEGVIYAELVEEDI